MRVLVIEDERKVAIALKEGLEAEAYTVEVECTGDGGSARLAAEAFDIIVLDLGLPGRSGLEILADIRRRRVATLVLVLTARDSIEDRVIGLDAGADDYLVKPFAFTELLARMRALGRHVSGAAMPPASRLSVGPVSLDVLARRALRDGETIDLTTREVDLLACLMRCEGQVVSRDTLARHIWNEPSRSATLDNVIDVHIARLRRKLDGDQRHPLIHTIRGVGYMMKDGTT
jgi:two-component system, OmpR family, copper resistance phosphate regulon response regulator CusR